MGLGFLKLPDKMVAFPSIFYNQMSKKSIEELIAEMNPEIVTKLLTVLKKSPDYKAKICARLLDIDHIFFASNLEEMVYVRLIKPVPTAESSDIIIPGILKLQIKDDDSEIYVQLTRRGERYLDECSPKKN